MCGIWLSIGVRNAILDNYQACLNALHNRGPEDRKLVDISGVAMFGFTRLAINGLRPEGMQPMTNGQIWWMCNGEIYNWKQLANDYGISTHSGSDCEVLGELYMKIVGPGTDPSVFFRLLDGVFAIAIADLRTNTLTLGRDPYGIRPLFIGERYGYAPNSTDMNVCTLMAASEIKALHPFSTSIQSFEPGTCEIYDMKTMKKTFSNRYHTIPSLKNPMFYPSVEHGIEYACMGLRKALESAVQKRMLTERPVAALLSGGIDSSLIASLVAKELRNAGVAPLKTFSVGMLGSQDLFYARKVADWIGSDHHEIILSADDFFQAIPHVIRDIESYDTTTVRASVGNWLVAKAVKEYSDCKVVFNGDGSDEVFGSYLYFYNAPHNSAYEEEVTRLLSEISTFDVLRSDRSISSHGLEARTPFLDKQFVAVARSISTEWLRPVRGKQVEKWILRRAFDDGVTLPREVLWRRKEAFSDGVSSSEKSWYEIIQEKAEGLVPSNWKELASTTYRHLPPQTQEQYLYRFYFETDYGKSSCTLLPHFWMPRWSPGATDPSARTLDVYGETTQS
jgi:asparagine synthase (glutamine-hydrolysing)